MAVRIKFDNNHVPLTPTFVLANRNGNKLGVIPALHINVGDHLNAATELQFAVQRELDGVPCALWDDITDFKLVWCPEWDEWFEIHVESKDGDSVLKNVGAVSLGEAELSQINLYNIEINTETDIAMDDYVVTVLYDEDNPKGSLLHRITEKAPHYTIGHVDDSIAGIQRTFTFDNTTIMDAFNQIAEEIDCLFVIDSGSASDGSIARTINVYDLESVCRNPNCGFRGVFTGRCPECGGDDVSYGYGENTNIYVSSENLTDEITYTSNTDSVKNCFRLTGGDDLMTAAIASCNPNGSSYLWYFSDAMRSDMSETLQARLTAYDNEYSEYVNQHAYSLPNNLLYSYNALINKYATYRDTLQTITNPITGYSSLMNAYYDVIDFEMLLRNELMPSVEISEKTAATEAAKLTSNALSPTAVTDLSICSLATASSAVLSVAKQIVDKNYQVKVNGISFNKPTWRGNFTVTNYSDEEDTATSATINVTITDDQEAYLTQRIQKILTDADEDIVGISGLFDIRNVDLTRFGNEIKKYCLASLNGMRDTCQACLDIMIEQGVPNDKSWAGTDTDLYTAIYMPYYNRLNALIAEVALRESELEIITGMRDENGGVVKDGMQTVIQGFNEETQSELDFEDYLGEELSKELASYRREDTYENDNFISDGLSNSELFERAREFIELAKKEIYKSATLQHSISSTLKNLLVMREFAELTNQFRVGNWLSVGVAGNVYRLRLVSYEIDFDDLEDIKVEFSDVTQTFYGLNDLASVLKSAASMATAFGSVKRQADRGDKTRIQFDEYKQKGLALTSMKIINSADNQNVTMDQHGLLCRELVPYNEEYDDRQLKIINRGLYLTKDGWETSTAGIGDFMYYDPRDGTLKQDYGVVANVLVGNLVLSEEVGVYNQGGSIRLDKDGLTLVSQMSGGTYNNVFCIKRQNGATTQDVIWFDNDGNAHFSGELDAASGTFAGELNAASGTFAGSLSAASGTFAGSLSAASGTFAGTMSANGITGGTLVLGGQNNGSITVKDANDRLLGSWDSAGIDIRSGTISGASVTLGGNNNISGTLNIKDASGNTIGTLNKDGLTLVSKRNTGASTYNNVLRIQTQDGNTIKNVIYFDNGGNAHFDGKLDAASGTFAGELNAASGTFAGSLSAASGTFEGTMSANGITGGTLVLGGQNNGSITVKDANDQEIGSWKSSGISINSGYIRLPYNDNVEHITGHISIGVHSTLPFVAEFTDNSAGSGITKQIAMHSDNLRISDITNNNYNYLYYDHIYIRKTSGNAGAETTPRIALSDETIGRALDFDARLGLRFETFKGIDGGPYIPGEPHMITTSSSYGSSAEIEGNLTVSGTKSRAVSADQYSERLLYCYETPTPMFGDIGEGVISEDGKCYIYIDSVFAQTVTTLQYQVQLQKYGSGDCWVSSRNPAYFVVEGTPGLSFGWEIKAKQRDYDQLRLDKNEEPFTVPKQTYGVDAAQHIKDIQKERLEE